MKKLIVLLMVLLLTVVLVGCGNDGNYWQSEDYYTQSQVDELIQNAIDELGEEIENDIPQQYYSKDELEHVSHELDMTVALYEAKLDWYEEQHNIDLDDVPNDFILWLIEEHPEVYAYWLERG